MTEMMASPGLEELRRLFQSELGAVKFPGVDGSVLEAAAARVQAAAAEVERAEAVLATARQTLVDAEEDELARAHRALAYARVYAEDAPDLHLRLESIALPLPREQQPQEETASAAPRRRGRTPKTKPSSPSLFAPSLAALPDLPEAEATREPLVIVRDAREPRSEAAQL